MYQTNFFPENLDNSDAQSRMQTLPQNKSGYTCKINKRISLGSGSFGTVFPGYFKSPSGYKIVVAVKIINIKQLKRQNQQYLMMLENQKKIYKETFMSKYIVKLYSCIRHKDSIYFVMEKCDEDLSLFLSKNELDEKQIRFYFRQILLGYNELYKRKIEHNDIKPENILVKDKSILKLADFGLAHSSMDSNSSFARINRSWNTTSPQVRFKGLGKITSKSDMWSLGIVLYWMKYKKYPYQQKSVVQNYKTKPEFPLISSQLKNILSNLIEFDPDKRWDFPKLFADPLFNKQHFIEDQLNSTEYLFEEPIFIEISQLSSCLDRKPSIEQYLYDDEFYEDEIETSLKKQIQFESSVIKLKINYLKLLIKKIQTYSVYNFEKQYSRRRVLFLKKLTIEAIKHYINYFYQELSDNSNFLSYQTLAKAKQNQQAKSYLSYLSAVCKIQVNRWKNTLIQQNSLLKNYENEIDNYRWILKKNWKHTRPNIVSHLSSTTKDFIKLIQTTELKKKEQYHLLHYLFLFYYHKNIFSSLKSDTQIQQLHKFISYYSQSQPTIHQQCIQTTLKQI